MIRGGNYLSVFASNISVALQQKTADFKVVDYQQIYAVECIH
jgi:hypothetical protein